LIALGGVRSGGGLMPATPSGSVLPPHANPAAAMRGDPDLAPELRELEALNEAMRALTSTLELSAVLHAVLERIKTFTVAEALSLLLYDAEREELVFAATETLRENVLVGA